MLSRAYPIMLSGSALNHYHTSTMYSTKAKFNELCTATQEYFENIEGKRDKLARWDKLNLQLSLSENEGKGNSTLECFEILIHELRQPQHCLDKELQSNLAIRIPHHKDNLSTRMVVQASRISAPILPII